MAKVTKELWLLLNLIAAFGLYYDGELLTISIEDIGATGIKAVFFILVYAISSIYLYHGYRLVNRPSAKPRFVLPAIQLGVSILVPILLFGGGIENPSLANLASLLILVALDFDYRGQIRERISALYDQWLGRANYRSDLFLRYPPKSLSDIYVQLIFITIVGAAIYLLMQPNS